MEQPVAQWSFSMMNFRLSTLKLPFQLKLRHICVVPEPQAIAHAEELLSTWMTKLHNTLQQVHLFAHVAHPKRTRPSKQNFSLLLSRVSCLVFRHKLLDVPMMPKGRGSYRCRGLGGHILGFDHSKNQYTNQHQASIKTMVQDKPPGKF